MDCLPQELLDKIVSFLEPDDQDPPIASISRKFQIACERLRFRKLKIDSDDLDDFVQIMDARPERRFYLKSLFVNLRPLPQRPTLGPRSWWETPDPLNFETPSARHEANTSIGRSLRRLFEIIAAWSQIDGGDSPSLELRIENSDHGGAEVRLIMNNPSSSM